MTDMYPQLNNVQYVFAKFAQTLGKQPQPYRKFLAVTQ